MDEDLVGYLLNALDEDSQKRVEVYLRDDPGAQRRLETLRQALEPLAADREEIAPPSGLAFRTLARVAEYRCRPVPELPPAPPVVRGSWERRWWFRPDVVVAATILLIVGTLSVQGVSSVRATATRLDCADNLRNWHDAMMIYSSMRGGDLPGVPLNRGHGDPWDIGGPAHPPDVPLQAVNLDSRMNVAGIFVPQLRDSGCLGSKISIRCPGNGERVFPPVSYTDLQNMSPPEFQKTVSGLARCYAYSLGYRDPAGEHCGLRRDLQQPDLNNDLLPIMADRSSILPNDSRGNSSNHPKGQNVLFMGGNVRFCSSPNVGIDGDNIYINKEGKVAAGVDRFDSVLARSGERP